MPIAADIYYSETGKENLNAPPVILIHGAGSSHLSWPAEIRRIKGFRVLSLDLPGHGSSTGSAEQNINEYAQMLSQFMETSGIYKALLVGHSMGGAIALQKTLNQPKNTIGMVLISSGAYLGHQNEILEYLANPATYNKALKLIQEKTFNALTDQDLILKSIQILKKTRPGVLYCDWLACSKFDLRSEIKKIKTPACILTGSADQMVPPSFSYFLQSNLKKSELQILRNQGHLPQLEVPQLVRDKLLHFVNSLPAYNPIKS